MSAFKKKGFGRNGIAAWLSLVAVGGAFLGGPAYAEGTQSSGYLFNWSGIGKDFGEAAANKGVYFFGVSAGATQTTLTGLSKKGTDEYDFSLLGVDLDLQKMMGLTGAHLRFITDLQLGQTGSNGMSAGAVGFYTPFDFGDEFKLKELAYHQDIFDKRAFFEVGRLSDSLSLGGGFDAARWQCWFFSFTCGNPGAYALDGSKPGYPDSVWAAGFKVFISRNFYFKAGVFSNEPDVKKPNHGGWPGPDWGFNNRSGVFIPMQFGYVSTPEETAYPAAYLIGGFIDTAPTADQFLNSEGLPQDEDGGTAQIHGRSSSIWFSGQQMVYPFDGSGQRGVTLFAAANIGTSPYLPVRNQVNGGARIQGMFLSRPLDSINMLVSHLTLGSRELEYGNSLLEKEGISSHLPNSETAFEINYAAPIAPGLTLSPYLQYVINQDQYVLHERYTHIPDEVSFGLQFSLNFNDLFGLPSTKFEERD